MVTHYHGGAAGPVIFGVGYNDIKSRWLVGAVLTILTFLVHITLGVVVEYADRLEHVVNILVILQLHVLRLVPAHPSHLLGVSDWGFTACRLPATRII